MYRIIEMSGTLYAIELLTSGRGAAEELEEMQELLDTGASDKITIVTDYEEVGAKLIIRDFL